MRSHAAIYKIENVVNGKAYIGASMDYATRIAGHKSMLKRGNHHCHRLQSDYNYLTQGCFTFNPVVICQEWQLADLEEGTVAYHHATRGVYNSLPHLPYGDYGESFESYRKRKEFFKKNNLVDISIEQAQAMDKVYRHGFWYDIAKIDKRRSKVMITRKDEKGWWSDIDCLNYYKMKANDITAEQLKGETT